MDYKIKDRVDAGKKLAQKIKLGEWTDPYILALPRGGVPVAHTIASHLNLDWNILLVKKIGAPLHPEFAIGAVAEDDVPLWNQWALSRFGYSPKELDEEVRKAKMKISSYKKKWRKDRKLPELAHRDVLLVDDGLATGMTMKASIQYLRSQNVKRIGVLVPVASGFAKHEIEPTVESFICLEIPEPFSSVSLAYQDFTQVSDSTVTQLLNERNKLKPFERRQVQIPAAFETLPGLLTLPENPKALIIFAHGSGSTHKSVRNQFVAEQLNSAGYATLLFDLLTAQEGKVRENVFNIDLLSNRLLSATKWAQTVPELKTLSLNYFGASTGAAAALVAVAKDETASSVVSRGGRPDLAHEYLNRIKCPVLLLVGDQDHGVIEYNEEALALLKKGSLEYIPNAGHLFEEPGALEAVADTARNWWDQNITTQQLRKGVHRLDFEDSINPLIEKISKSKVVMLGEATHGTEEFYRVRRRISQKLIEEHNFNFIAVEGDWPSCFSVNQFIKGDSKTSALKILENFKRWPRWMWANEQTRQLMEWMKDRKVGFYGLDIYSFNESLERIKETSKDLDPDDAAEILNTYACLDKFEGDEMSYAQAVTKGNTDCDKHILKNLRHILRLRLRDTSLKEEDLLDLQQNAKILKNAEGYYRAMLEGGAESWNLRDEHMMETLERLLNFYGSESKAIVWAHNTHIGDYHATDMLKGGYINLGGLARERYGIENVSLVGFGTYEGEVLAGRAWGAPPEKTKVPPAKSGSFESDFHQMTKEIDAKDFYLLLNGEEEFEKAKDHRAIGVVYQTQFEAQGRNYVPTELSNRYDAFIFLDKTTALRPLSGSTEKHRLPETWPTGL